MREESATTPLMTEMRLEMFRSSMRGLAAWLIAAVVITAIMYVAFSFPWYVAVIVIGAWLLWSASSQRKP